MKLIIHERVTLDGLTHLPGEIEVDEARAAKLLATFKGGEVSVADENVEPANRRAEGGLIANVLPVEPESMETFVPVSAVEKALAKLTAAEDEPGPETPMVGGGKGKSK